MLRLLALVLPLALDTFAVAAALGLAGPSRSQRLRMSLVLAAFEAGMPVIGVGLGKALGHAIGSLAEYGAGAILVALGAFLVLGRDDDADRATMLAHAHGLALVGVGIGISLDELAVGFSVGLLHLPLAWAIVLIAVQAFLAAQLGVRFGGRVREQVRERVERAAGLALGALGVSFIVARVVS